MTEKGRVEPFAGRDPNGRFGTSWMLREGQSYPPSAPVNHWTMASGTRCSKDFHSLLCGPHEAYRDNRFPLGLGTFEAACAGMLILLGIAIEADVIG